MADLHAGDAGRPCRGMVSPMIARGRIDCPPRLSGAPRPQELDLPTTVNSRLWLFQTNFYSALRP